MDRIKKDKQRKSRKSGAGRQRPVREILASNGGMTIVSVLVAFVLLLLGISMFYAAILASQRMLNKAHEIDLATQQALEEFYEGGASGLTGESYSGDDAEEFYGDSAESETENTAEQQFSVITLQESGGSDTISVRIPSDAAVP